MSDRYEILNKLGQGGIGAVYRALDLRLAREVAIKRLLPQDEKPEAARKTGEHLIHEAGMLSKLQHPNIVHVFEAAMDEEGAYIVMELVQGETLDKVVEKGTLGPRDFVNMMQQALEALIAAQAIGMMHRDLKPTNVILRRQASGRYDLKVLDFGLAKISAQPTLQTIDHGNSILGSIYFMAPEQFEHQPLDGRTDLYALGCLGYFALTGEYPFQGETAALVMDAHLDHRVIDVHELRPSLPLPLADWLMRMMSLSVDDRPDNAQAALKSLDVLAENLLKRSLEEKAPVEKKGTVVISQVAAPAIITTNTKTRAVNISAKEKTTGVLRQPLKEEKSFDWLGPVVVAAIIISLGFIALELINKSDAKTSDNSTTERPQLRTTNWINDNGVYLPHKVSSSRPLEKYAYGGFNWGKVSPAAELIPTQSNWYYWPPNDAPPPKEWKQRALKKTGWLKGRAPIGLANGAYFKNGTKLERVPIPPKGKPLSPLYIRNEFVIDDSVTSGPLEIYLRADDGAVVYLNNIEVRRVGMPTGAITDHTPATRNVSWPGTTRFSVFRVSEKQVKKGVNIVAFRVHPRNIAKYDKDIAFDAAIYLLPPATPLNPPNNFLQLTKPNFIVPTSHKLPQSWKFAPKVSLLSPWEKPEFNDKTWKSGAAPFGVIPKDAKIPVDTPWTSENLFLRRTFTLSKTALNAEKVYAFAVKTSAHATVSVNGVFAFEIRNPLIHGYSLVEMTLPVRSALREGENVIAVHLGSKNDLRFFDLGITEVAPKK